MMELHGGFQENLSEHIEVFSSLVDIEPQVAAVGKTLSTCLRSGRKILIAGNGGSAADCQHFAAELTGRFVNDRRPLNAISLTTDTSAITAIANDYGYEHIFSRQIKGLAKKGDCFIGISTSGNSSNIIRAVDVAKLIGVKTIALCGSRGQLKSISDFTISVPHTKTMRIQEAHIFILHILCAIIETELAREPLTS